MQMRLVDPSLIEQIKFRNLVNQNPERAFYVTNTRKFIAKELWDAGLQVKTDVGRNGVVGIKQGQVTVFENWLLNNNGIDHILKRPLSAEIIANSRFFQLAVVERSTENPRVGGSIPPLGTIISSTYKNFELKLSQYSPKNLMKFTLASFLDSLFLPRLPEKYLPVTQRFCPLVE